MNRMKFGSAEKHNNENMRGRQTTNPCITVNSDETGNFHNVRKLS